MLWLKTLFHKRSILNEYFVQKAKRKFSSSKTRLRRALSQYEQLINDLTQVANRHEQSMYEVEPKLSKASLTIHEKQVNSLRWKILLMLLFEFTINYWAAGLFSSNPFEKFLFAGMVSLIPAFGLVICLKNIFTNDAILNKKTQHVLAFFGGLISFAGFWFLAEFLSTRAELFITLLANKGVNSELVGYGFKIASAAIGIALAAAIGVYIFELQLRHSIIKGWRSYHKRKGVLENKIRDYRKKKRNIEIALEAIENSENLWIQQKVNKMRRWYEFWKRLKIKVPEDEASISDNNDKLIEVEQHRNNGNRRLLPVVINTTVIVLLIAMFSGCQEVKQIYAKIMPDVKHTRFRVGLDNSLSNNTMMNRIPDILRRIASNLGEQDRFMVQVIDGYSETRAQTLLDHIMSDDFGPSNLFAQAERDKLIAKISKVDSLLVERSSFRGRTDILGYLRTVSSQLDTSNYFERIILLTDGINSTQELNMYTEQDLVKALKKLSIPDLKGVEIYFVGVTEDGNRISNQRYHEIKKFWVLYCEKANAKLRAYSYDHEVTFLELAKSKSAVLF